MLAVWEVPTIWLGSPSRNFLEPHVKQIPGLSWPYRRHHWDPDILSTHFNVLPTALLRAQWPSSVRKGIASLDDLVKPGADPAVVEPIATKLAQPKRHPVLVDPVGCGYPRDEERPRDAHHQVRSAAM